MKLIIKKPSFHTRLGALNPGDVLDVDPQTAKRWLTLGVAEAAPEPEETKPTPAPTPAPAGEVKPKPATAPKKKPAARGKGGGQDEVRS